MTLNNYDPRGKLVSQEGMTHTLNNYYNIITTGTYYERNIRVVYVCCIYVNADVCMSKGCIWMDIMFMDVQFY